MTDPRPGDRFGPYVIDGEIGRGGMGVVYRARDVALGREVALKIAPREVAANAELRARIEREARALAAVSHPNVVTVHFAGEHRGVPFIALELVRGGSLGDRVRAQGPIPWREAASLGAGIARGLEAVHAAGLVHRDVKPNNVLVAPDGRPKLTDFGLVRHDDLSALTSPGDPLTRTGVLLGTIGYMAPEQADGGSPVDARADVFALGATIYALIAGRPPFEGEGLDAVKQLLAEDPAPLREVAPGVPPALDALVTRLLSRDPAARGTAGAAAVGLEAIALGAPGGARALLVVGALLTTIGLCWSLSLLVRRDVATPTPTPLPSSTRSSPVSTGKEARRLAGEALAHVRAGRNEKARESVARALELDPGCALAWALRAIERLEAGDAAGTIEPATRALELDPRLGLALAARAAAELELPDREDRAIEDANRATELDPNLARAWAVRGDVRLKKRDLDGAIADATRAIELDPSRAQPYGIRGTAFLAKRDGARALADLKRATDLAPGTAGYWTSRAYAHELLGKRANAKADLDKAIELAPALREARLGRASIRGQEGDQTGAIEDLSYLITLDPRDAVAWRDRAVARANLSHWREAADDATRALELAPGTARLHVVRGQALGNLGDREGAIRDLTRYLEREPWGVDAPAARKMLAALRR